MNEEARKKARTAGKDNYICVCCGTLLVSCAVTHGRCYLSCTCDLPMGLAMDVFRGHVSFFMVHGFMVPRMRRLRQDMPSP